jgi:hypothetical protein
MRYGGMRVAYGGLALSWLRKELYWVKVEGVYWHDRSELRVSAEGFSRIMRVVCLDLKPSGAAARRGGEKFSSASKQVRLLQVAVIPSVGERSSAKVSER